MLKIKINRQEIDFDPNDGAEALLAITKGIYNALGLQTSTKSVRLNALTITSLTTTDEDDQEVTSQLITLDTKSIRALYIAERANNTPASQTNTAKGPGPRDAPAPGPGRQVKSTAEEQSRARVALLIAFNTANVAIVNSAFEQLSTAGFPYSMLRIKPDTLSKMMTNNRIDFKKAPLGLRMLLGLSKILSGRYGFSFANKLQLLINTYNRNADQFPLTRETLSNAGKNSDIVVDLTKAMGTIKQIGAALAPGKELKGADYLELTESLSTIGRATISEPPPPAGAAGPTDDASAVRSSVSPTRNEANTPPAGAPGLQAGAATFGALATQLAGKHQPK